jgi:hypothetical protein
MMASAKTSNEVPGHLAELNAGDALVGRQRRPLCPSAIATFPSGLSGRSVASGVRARRWEPSYVGGE